MEHSDEDARERILKRAQELLSRDLSTWRPPLRMRIRWWNCALGCLILVGAVAIILPLKNAAYRQGFSGNLVSSAWQLIAGSAVAWILFNRFKVERLKRVLPMAWDRPFREMTNIAQTLYPVAIVEAAELRETLGTEIRDRLRQAVVNAYRKASIFGRFLEVEQLADIDECCDAAENLACIDNHLPDPQFMSTAIHNIFVLYASSSKVRGYTPSGSLLKALHSAYERWSTAA